MTDRLFVYGTLRQDVPNSVFHQLLDGDARLIGNGRMQGKLYDLGRYPGFVAGEEPDRWVRGEVYELADPQRTLARLDDYEGCGEAEPQPHRYQRVERDVILDDERRLTAWVYNYKRPIDRKERIVSGDYLGWTGK